MGNPSEVAALGARESTIAAHPTGPQATEGWHHWERHLEVMVGVMVATLSSQIGDDKTRAVRSLSPLLFLPPS